MSERLAEAISVETLAGLVDLSPFHFSRVFKQTTGMSPLQFVTRERITRAQQLIRVFYFSLSTFYLRPPRPQLTMERLG